MKIYKSLEEAIGIFGGSPYYSDRGNYGHGGSKQLANFDPDPDLEPELREEENAANPEDDQTLEELLFLKDTSEEK